MNFFNSKNKFLDMKNLEITSHSIVIVDNTFSNFVFEPNQQVKLQIKNPFDPIANELFLKSRLNMEVVKMPNSDQIHREFLCGKDILIKYDFFPPRLHIQHNTSEDSREPESLAKDLIEFADLGSSVGAIGVNYEMFIQSDVVKVKEFLLKNDVAQEFSSLSAVLVLNISNERVLNLRVAEAEVNGKVGIYCEANFHCTIIEPSKINKILEEDFLTFAKNKIEAVFNK